jgi:hypothetical protein
MRHIASIARWLAVLVLTGIAGCSSVRHDPCECFDEEAVECDPRGLQDCRDDEP